ncbi:hypothetical protein NNC19_16295 [Clostridium sp. SHJSY1]|uniref:hypothetical protein n=1 Tax=Clostridium sp. SHJSY1 TaxID=2942483 RepID=UPI002876CCAF|nr:hypothetical protein [Clostridium sp. SHJSY1]MDS0527252.1 hypothetical protein [Clostridium sp. SHJSY1]
MNPFSIKRFEKIEDKEKRKEELQKLKKENLGNKDILALMIALFQLVLPFVLIIGGVYFLIILFMTKVWMK